MNFNNPEACWDSESRQSPYSTVADPNEEYCEDCENSDNDNCDECAEYLAKRGNR